MESPLTRRLSCSCIAFSVLESRAEVASSRRRILGFFKIVLAMLTAAHAIRTSSNLQECTLLTSLFFAAAQLDTAFADNGLIAFGPFHNPVVDLCHVCCFHDFLVWCGYIAVLDVAEDRIVEDHTLLLDHPQSLSKGSLSVLTNVFAFDCSSAR